MLKTIMAATAVSALALTSALAQSTTAPATAPATATAQAPDAATHATFIARQAPDQWLASKFRGTDVIGVNNEKIGDVDDILFDKNGSIVAYVIGVGGFLGIGSKDVALAPSSFQVLPGKDASDYKLQLSMTKEQLKTAAAFEGYAPPRPSASSNPANPSPMGGAPTRPSTNKQ